MSARSDRPRILTFGPEGESERRSEFGRLLDECPIPESERLMNLGLFLTPQTLSRVLFLDFLYRQILETQGVVMEFGCRWGQSVSIFTALRGIYEPFNRLRKIVGFDSFAGFPTTSERDGSLAPGDYSVTEGYETYLERILAHQEQESPLAHVRKFEIVKGDVTETLDTYLKRNPETIIALAYFDLDLYEPTRHCLEAIRDRVTRGTVIGFDELNDHATPGETEALREVLSLRSQRVRRYPYSSRTSYLVVE